MASKQVLLTYLNQAHSLLPPSLTEYHTPIKLKESRNQPQFFDSHRDCSLKME